MAPAHLGPRATLRMTAAQYAALRRHLLADREREQLAFLLCGRHEAPDGERILLTREVIVPAAEALERQSAGRVVASQWFSRVVLERARDERLELLDVHSHPGSDGPAVFSTIDDENEATVARYVAERLPGRWYGAMVFTQADVDTRVWGGTGRGDPVPLAVDQIVVYGDGIEVLRPYSRRAFAGEVAERRGASGSEDAWAPFARQVDVVGAAGQARLLAAHVAVVGSGGLGSAVAVTLAHLGIGRLTLIDPDVVEHSNLNRLFGATRADADSGRAKVDVLARYARSVRPEMRVTAVRAALDDAEAWEGAAGCDALLVCVDNDGARLLANRLAVQYLVPMIDLATGIDVGAGGAIHEAGGQVRTVLPGGFCLQCIDGLDRAAAARERAPAAMRAVYRERGYVTGAEVPAPSVATLNLAVAAEGVNELLALLTEVRRPRSYLLYDWRGAQWHHLSAVRRNDCVVCGPGGYAAAGDREPLAAAIDVALPPFPRDAEAVALPAALPVSEAGLPGTVAAAPSVAPLTVYGGGPP